jgi:HlyD family secretion protein
MENKPNIELRSDEVNDILGRPPAWIVRWGISVILFIVVILLAGSVIFKYPDKVTAPIVITSENMPVKVLALSGGRITYFPVSDHETVQKNQLIAVIENTTNIEHYSRIENICDSLSAGFSLSDNISELPLPQSLVLGELQEEYTSLAESVSEYQTFVKNDFHRKKIARIKNQIEYQKMQVITASRQVSLSEEAGRISGKIWERDSSLFARQATSASDMELSKKGLLSSIQQLESQRSNLNSLRIALEQAEQEVFNLEEERLNRLQEFRRVMKSKLDNLRAEMAAWEKRYLLRSPVKGRISLSKFWDVNQNIHTGDVIATVIPEGETKIIGKIFMPVSGAGKVKSGQRVNIKIDNYPYLEFGMITDSVEKISEVPVIIDNKNVYVVTVQFPRKLVTGYKIELPGNEEMTGVAEIITNDVSILKRIMYPVRHIIERLTQS